MSKQQGLLLCGHGSRDPEGTAAFRELVAGVQTRHPDIVVDYGFLEFAHPVYAAAVERMYQKGVRQMIALPVMLFAGGHAKNDIPYELNTLQRQYPDLTIIMGHHLGITPALLQLSKKIIGAAAPDSAPAAVALSRADACLLVVGRGTADPDANSDVAKLARLLGEGLGFGFATTAFISVTTPSLKDTLPLVERLPFQRVIVLPVFLFTGVLLKRIYQQVEEHRAVSEKEYWCTTSYGNDALLLDAIDARFEEAKLGNTAMNCQLCKYREQMIGFEPDAGAVQAGHHLNVKGILFEEEDKPGRSAGLLPVLKKILGI
jgi:sirohydrochlorin cobaltochelatase